MEKEKTVKIFSYTKVWKVEKKIHAVGKFVLPTPINPYDFVGYAIVIFAAVVLNKIFPPFANIPFVIRYIGAPYIIVNYFGKKKLDGKNPIMFFVGYLSYLSSVKGTYLQLFRKYPERKKKIVLKWDCGVGR